MNNTILDLTAIQQAVTSRLLDRIKARVHAAEQISPQYGQLWQAIATISPHGKRLRPYLTYLSYHISGGQHVDTAIDTGVALELLHLSVLALDDFIDRDYIRHGQPNIAGLYRENYRELVTNNAERDHFANSSELQGGYLLFSELYQALLAARLDQPTHRRVMELVDYAIFTVAGGELLDTEAPLYPVMHTDSLQVAEYKTAYYSCGVPLMVGAVLAGADRTVQDRYGEIGKHLGIAYQLRDDLLGTFGNEAQTGKSVYGDLREAKRTYLLQSTYRLASETERTMMDNIFSNHRDDKTQLQRVKELMVSTGARDATEALAAENIASARGALKLLREEYPLVSLLDDFIQQLVGRSA